MLVAYEYDEDLDVLESHFLLLLLLLLLFYDCWIYNTVLFQEHGFEWVGGCIRTRNFNQPTHNPRIIPPFAAAVGRQISLATCAVEGSWDMYDAT